MTLAPHDFKSVMPSILAGTNCPSHEQTMEELAERMRDKEAEYGKRWAKRVNVQPKSRRKKR